MGLRYRIPFKDYRNNAYEVLIYREDYGGEATELTGAPSCFVVTGTDEDFVYTPVRTSSATINVLDSELLLDLYSINNQYAAVKLMKNGVLEWTGYIRPEQFTQPYVNVATNVGVECVSALATLEHVVYEELSPVGVVSMWTLLKYLVNRAGGEYRGVYVPWVYGASASMMGNVLERITLIENNFVKEELNLLEVLEHVCKFLNWTVHDVNGCLWFVDADWKGAYRMYDEALENYEEVTVNEVMVQDVGYNGSDGNTLDMVPGYNKASVKALNHVFEDVVKDEEYDILTPYDDGKYLVGTYKGDDGAHGVRKQFLKPIFWKLHQYDAYGNELDASAVEGYSTTVLNYTKGALLMKEVDYKCVDVGDPTPDEGVTDFDYTDSVQIRFSSEGTMEDRDMMEGKPAIEMIGENAVYSDCAMSIDFTIKLFYDKDMLEVQGYVLLDHKVKVKVELGGKFYNGTSWVDNDTTFEVEFTDEGNVVSNRTPFTPYKGISGYVIPIEFFVGQPKITIFCHSYQLLTGYDATYTTGVKMHNLKFGYAKKEGIVEEGENGDRVYENVVNEKYMSEAEEIEFGISSYNADGASYSKAMIDGGWLTDNLYCAVVGKTIRPEELMIRRIVNRYGVTKIKLTEALQITDSITPLTVLSDRSMVNKRFRMTSGEWDYEQNRLTLQMQEDA